MTANFRELLPVLTGHDVQYILIGGGAAIAHGSARSTVDVDVVYSRSEENISRLAGALEQYNPHGSGTISMVGGKAGMVFQ